MTEHAEIAARLAAATPGPWEVHNPYDILADISAPGRKRNAVVYGPSQYDDILPEDDDRVTNPHTNWREDADFIAHAPSDIAFLLAENATLREALRKIGAHCPGAQTEAEVYAIVIAALATPTATAREGGEG